MDVAREPGPDRLPALDHVQVAAPPGCEAQARRFYGQLLGLPELDKPGPLRDRGGAWFGLHAGQLHVGVVEADRAGAGAFIPARKAHPALRVGGEAALRALADRLIAGGAEVAWDETLPGQMRFFTADPWGNRLELLA